LQTRCGGSITPVIGEFPDSSLDQAAAARGRHGLELGMAAQSVKHGSDVIADGHEGDAEAVRDRARSQALVEEHEHLALPWGERLLIQE
jgi:hypothetical protein